MLKVTYILKPFIPEITANDDIKALAPLAGATLFKCRTKARRYQAMAEIENQPTVNLPINPLKLLRISQL